ncbi:HAMP domain-containing histidine kinase [Paenibacillus mesophilus]|nr:HAMP domain-containing histidine kinase [Paenibacillus mesophilus]
MYGWGMQTPVGPLNKWFLLTTLVAYVSISLFDAYYLYRMKGAFSEQWRNGYVLTLGKLASASMVNKSMLYKSVLVFAATLLFGPAIILITNESGTLSVLGIVYTAFFLLLLLPYLFQRLRMFNAMLSGASEIAAGQLNVTFEERGNGQTARMMRQLNNMKLGYQAALERQLRSERQKSELISNVSHDLKTPLTSMINFVDLLKKENLPQHDLNRYVQVLDRKTQRLKVLIDDLFEVSQLTGGAVRPVLEPVNASALLQQALAEFADKIDASGLQFRVHIGNPHMIARLDGKKTWRVFENLIDNALNYSMPNTRVHVSLTEENEYIVLRINNVSAYEINCEAEELFERSKRGDASRHTEGSGLGLAIARSIVELQGGRMFIEIDGDYFKVTVMLIK